MIIERRIAYLLPRGSSDYLEIRGENTRSLIVGRVLAMEIGASRTYYIVEGHDFSADTPGEPRTRYHALYLDTVQDDRAKAESVLLGHLRSVGPVSFWRKQI